MSESWSFISSVHEESAEADSSQLCDSVLETFSEWWILIECEHEESAEAVSNKNGFEAKDKPIQQRP